ncbi:helix-turn-helix domain-containing protein, partial [Collinsella aerofaciens]
MRNPLLPRGREEYRLAEKLRQLRSLRGLTQREVAQVAGIDESTVRNYELARRMPKPEQVRSLAAALEVMPEALIPFDPAADHNELFLMTVELADIYGFEFGINDITCSLIHSIIYANQIPQDNYKIYLLSDGTATYNFMNEAFNAEGVDPAAKEAQLEQSWLAAKEYAYKNGQASSDYGWHAHWDSMYAVLKCEPNTEWWMTRANLFQSADGNAFANAIATDPAVKKKNVASMLTALQQRGDATVAAFKALYNFNDGYFTAAEAEGKKPMVLLGTYVNLEQSFEDYAKLTMTYYGDEYAYYYKGHPNTPTGLWPSKQDQLSSLG